MARPTWTTTPARKRPARSSRRGSTPYYRQIGPGRSWAICGRITRPPAAGSSASGSADATATRTGSGTPTTSSAPTAATCSRSSRPPARLRTAGRRAGRQAHGGGLHPLLRRTSRREASTRRSRSSGRDQRIVPTLGDYRVDRLTKTQIEAWRGGLVRDDPEDTDAPPTLAGHRESDSDHPQGGAE